MAVTVQTNATVNSLGNAGTNTVTVNKPSGTADGDLLVAFVGTRTSSVSAVPSGWTQIQVQSGSTNKFLYAYYKIASSEPSSWTWTLTSNAAYAGSVLRITGFEPTSPISLSATATSGVGTALTFSESLTPASASSLLLYQIYASRAATGITDISGYAIATDNPSWTELYDLNDNTSNSSDFALAYATRTQTTATGNATATVGGASAGEGAASIMISIYRTTVISVSDTETATDASTVARARVISVSDTETATDAIIVAAIRAWTRTVKQISVWLRTNKNI